MTETVSYVWTGSGADLILRGPTCPFCFCVRSHGPAAARRLGDNLVKSQAEPRLLSHPDSGAVRHSVHLGGKAERGKTPRGVWEGGMAGGSGRCHRKRRESGSEPRPSHHGRVYHNNMVGEGGKGGWWGGIQENQHKGMRRQQQGKTSTGKTETHNERGKVPLF